MVDIKGAFKTFGQAIDGIREQGTNFVITLIVLGVFLGAVTTGTITQISSNFNTTLASQDAGWSGYMTTAVGVVATIVALIVVVVLKNLFGKKGKGAMA